MVDPRSERAYYRQVADALRDRILSGELAPGDKLPTADTLARRHEVGLAVAFKALELLRNEGLIETARGRPARVRVSYPREVINVQRGSTLEVRQATSAERESMELGEGEPVVVVTHGARVMVLPASLVTFSFS